MGGACFHWPKCWLCWSHSNHDSAFCLYQQRVVRVAASDIFKPLCYCWHLRQSLPYPFPYALSLVRHSPLWLFMPISQGFWDHCCILPMGSSHRHCLLALMGLEVGMSHSLWWASSCAKWGADIPCISRTAPLTLWPCAPCIFPQLVGVYKSRDVVSTESKRMLGMQ